MTHPTRHPVVLHPQHPQTVEIPAPLEIHPSVDPELARGLINAVEYINEHPDEFAMCNPHFETGRGCIICHAERLSEWRRSGRGMLIDPIPLGHWGRIFDVGHWPRFGTSGVEFETNAGRIARIEHFLKTGE